MLLALVLAKKILQCLLPFVNRAGGFAALFCACRVHYFMWIQRAGAGDRLDDMSIFCPFRFLLAGAMPGVSASTLQHHAFATTFCADAEDDYRISQASLVNAWMRSLEE
jgi:hypothetical protein